MNPFDLKAALLARHAQHVVLIHFPIALFIVSVAFDLVAQWTTRRSLEDAAYYNLLLAAVSTLPVVATGILAWQFALEGQKLAGILLLHLVLACVSTGLILLVWWVHFRFRRCGERLLGYRIPLELVAVAILSLTAHLGGFLSGVNAAGALCWRPRCLTALRWVNFSFVIRPPRGMYTKRRVLKVSFAMLSILISTSVFAQAPGSENLLRHRGWLNKRNCF